MTKTNNKMNDDNFENRLRYDSIFIIGNVCSVNGRIIKVKVHKNKNTSHLLYNGNIIKNIAVNSYIKITKGYIDIIGKVTGEYITKKEFKTTKKDEIQE